MATFSFSSSAYFVPGTEDGWWNALSRTGWITVSFDQHTWVISLPGSTTLTFTSASGFTAPALASDPAGGIVDSIVWKDPAGAVLATVTGLGISASQLAADPLALVRGADTATGTASADTIAIGDGNDSLDAGAGNDSVFGGSGDDTLWGGAGNDTIWDFNGADQLFGGAGDDNLRSFGGSADGGDGNDILDLSRAAGLGGAGDDTITASAIAGGIFSIDAGSGNDLVTALYSEAAGSAAGGLGDDTLDADYRGGVLVDGQVDHLVYSGFEHLIVTSRGDTNVDASALTSAITLRLQSVERHATGTAGADTIIGNGDGNTIAGGLGDDVIDGGNSGGWIAADPGLGTDWIFARPFYDFVDYASASTAVTIDLNVPVQNTSQGADRLSNIEGVLGSAFNDTLVAAVGLEFINPFGLPSTFMGSRLYGNAGDDLLVGSAVADTLVGGAGLDSLQGNSGDDALDGREGADTLTGGAGADKFLLSLDGAVDRIVDFSRGEGDHLLVVNADGSITDGSQGLLSWDRSSRLLTWDPDSDAGAQAPIALATLDDAGSLGRANLAAGFQPSAIRAVYGDGSLSYTWIDWGAQAYDKAVASYDTAGRLVAYIVDNDNGSSISTWYDAAHTETWSSRSAEYASNGQLSLYAVRFDDGTLSYRWFDALNADTWSMRYAEYDPSGQLTAYSVWLDTGAQTIRLFDIANAEPWARTVQEYAANGQLASYSALLDTGWSWVRTFDVDNSQPWAYAVDDYDPAGRLFAHHTYDDNGMLLA